MLVLEYSSSNSIRILVGYVDSLFKDAVKTAWFIRYWILYSRVFHNFYFSPNIIRAVNSLVDETGKTYSTHARDEKYVQNLMEKIT